MKFEMSWNNEEGSVGTFNTSCPKMAELMMRSDGLFPQVTPAMKQEFQSMYGSERGKFENVLRIAQDTKNSILNIGITGLRVQIRTS